MLCSTAAKSRFIAHDAERNLHGSCYHVREPETQRMDMPVHEFVECARTWASRRLFLKVGLLAAAIMFHPAGWSRCVH